MTKKEFLKELTNALQGNVTTAQVNENVLFYDNYIMEETRKGRMEEQVLQELGNPRLLAKTIIDTSDHARQYAHEDTYQENWEEQNRQKSHRRGLHAEYSEEDGWDIRLGRFKLNSWYGYLTIIAVITLILFIIGSLFVAIVPILLPIILVLMIINYLFTRR